jgi:sugar O-acyltransferase (sialic acid O-acetyltransferase NeuD family)
MKNIIIIGSSGHSKVVIDIIEIKKEFNIVGLIDRFRVGEETEGYNVLGKEEDLPELIKKYSIHGVIVAVGDNFVRSKISKYVKEKCPNLEFISAIHPNTSISKNVSIGRGSMIMAGVIINSKSIVGESCILNTASSLGHDCVIKDFASIAPGVRVGGNCKIDELAAISIGAVLVHKINIGQETIIGAGSTVVNDIGPFVVAYGTPAKMIRNRKSGEKYV